MGKIKTEGRATLEFEPDLYEIEITVSAEGKTSGAAVTTGKKQVETLLQRLEDRFHVKSEQLMTRGEDVSKSYNSDCYKYSRRLMWVIPADNHFREAVTGMFAEMDDVAYSVEARLSDETQPNQMALDAALQNARQKAEQVAASMNCQVTEYEEICTDGIRPSGEMIRSLAKSVTVGDVNRASELQKPKIEIKGVVVVTWLTEPLT